jgi:hypothetical protein
MSRPMPWDLIDAPTAGVNARRVDPGHPQDYFWTRDPAGHPGLMLRLPMDLHSYPPRPSLAGIDLAIARDGPHTSLRLSLQDAQDAELFLALCTDLLESTREHHHGPAALVVVMRRLQRWQDLLRRARRRGLTDSEVRGLFGELVVFERFLTPWLGLAATVASWQGPAGAPQDFCAGSTALEVKTLLGSDRREVQISTIGQLESSLPRLVLGVVTLSIAPEGTGVTLVALVTSIRNTLKTSAPDTVEPFNDRLIAVGYADLDEYARNGFLIDAFDWFHVRDGFPRLVPSQLPSGISNVSYSVSLPPCEPFRLAALHEGSS